VSWSVHVHVRCLCPQPNTTRRCRSPKHQENNFLHLAFIGAYVVLRAFIQNPRLGVLSLCLVAVVAVATCWRIQATHKQRDTKRQAKDAMPQNGGPSEETPRSARTRGKQGLIVMHQDVWLIMWLFVDGVCLTFVVSPIVPTLLCSPTSEKFSEVGAGADRSSEVVITEQDTSCRLSLAEGVVTASIYMFCVLCLLLSM
jgi:hypothetical protein